MGKAVEEFRSMMNWEKEDKEKTIGDSASEDMNDLKKFSKSSQLLFTIEEATSTRVQTRKEPEVPLDLTKSKKG